MKTQFPVFVLLWSLSVVTCEQIDLSCDEIQQFVDGHNDRRWMLANGEVPGQPAAASMNYMVWDEELAAKAGNWAAENVFKHNPNRQVHSKRFTTGENIYWHASTNLEYKFDIDKALSAWWNEYKDFTFQKLKRTIFGKKVKVGHYTQMAWADSVNLGCGMSVDIKNGWKNFYVVCNYGPAGNYMGETPYTTGEPAGELICASDDCSRPYGDSCPSDY